MFIRECFTWLPTPSPPSRGAWIEMSIDARLDKLISSRPPRGGRGLKFIPVCFRFLSIMSPPSRGAWIEITSSWELFVDCVVAPLAGGVD